MSLISLRWRQKSFSLPTALIKFANFILYRVPHIIYLEIFEKNRFPPCQCIFKVHIFCDSVVQSSKCFLCNIEKRKSMYFVAEFLGNLFLMFTSATLLSYIHRWSSYNYVFHQTVIMNGFVEKNGTSNNLQMRRNLSFDILTIQWQYKKAMHSASLAA